MTMRRYPRTGTANSISALERRYHSPRPASALAEPEKLAPQFTPGQQLALLKLRNNELTRAIVEKLSHSTARECFADYVALAERGLAKRQASGFHAITPQGQWIASRLAAELAREFEIDPIHHKPRTRGMYEPGVKARFNFW